MIQLYLLHTDSLRMPHEDPSSLKTLLKLLASRPNDVGHAPCALLRGYNIAHLIAQHDLNFSQGGFVKDRNLTAAVFARCDSAF